VPLADDFASRQFATVEVFVGAATGAQGCAFQRDAGEEAAGARVREDLGAQDDVSGGLGIAALGARSGAIPDSSRA
jgi:hypothetical protein